MKKRVVYFDFLNIVSAFCVIALHCNGMVHYYTDGWGWKQALLVEVFGYWPVPIFLMLSGATLMGYRERYSTKDFFKKRFLRTAIPFVLWSLINAVINGVDFAALGVRGVINNITCTAFENVYWFFPVLFSVYFAIPVVSLLKDNRKILWYMVGGAFAFCSVLPIVFNWLGLWWNNSLEMVVVGGFLIFPILGYLLSTQDFKKSYRIALYIAAFACAVFRYVMVLKMSTADGATNRTYFDYLGFYSVILAVGVFVFAKNSTIIDKMGQNDKLVKIIKAVSGCSFGVYLIHMILLNHILIKIFPRDCLEWRVIGPFIVYLLAVAIVFVIRKIPVVNKIIP